MDQEQITYLIDYYMHLAPVDIKRAYYYPYLSSEEVRQQKIEIANYIVQHKNDQVYWNTCSKCAKLARTPKAQQCRHCGYDWHEP